LGRVIPHRPGPARLSVRATVGAATELGGGVGVHEVLLSCKAWAAARAAADRAALVSRTTASRYFPNQETLPGQAALDLVTRVDVEHVLPAPAAFAMRWRMFLAVV